MTGTDSVSVSTAPSARRHLRRRARALTLLEVVVASVLTLGLTTVMVKWSSAVQLLANAGTARTETERAAALVSSRLGADLDAATGCDALRRDRNVSSVAPGELVIYMDDDGDGASDRVSWRVQGTQLTRTTEHGLGSCSFSGAQPTVVVTNLVRATTPASFSLISAGALVTLGSRLDCATTPTNCNFDGLRLTLTLNGDNLAPYLYDRTFVLDRRLYTIGGAAGASSGTGYTVPSAPSSPLVRQVASGTIEVTWPTPQADGGSATSSYQVSVYSSTGTAATGVTGATTRTSTTRTYLFSGLTAGTSYKFAVAATNAVGTGSVSVLSAAQAA